MPVSSTSIVSVRSSVFAATADARFRGPITLARITLPDYGAAPEYTLRLSSQPYVDPDDQPWDPAMESPVSIDHGGGWLTIDWQPVDAVLTVQDRRLNGQGVDEVFSSLFADYPFIGAKVEILQAFDNLVSTSEFETVFEGEIAEIDAIDLRGVVFHCVQKRDWNVKVPPRTINVDEFPEAPKAAQGVALPIVLGDWETDNRYLDGAGGAHETVRAGIARGACPMICISSPTGSSLALPEHLISDDEIDQGPLAGGAPYDQWYMYESALDCLVGPGLGTLSNPTDGPATTALLSTQVTGAIIPIEVNAATNCDDPDWCLRKDKKRNLGDGFAYLNHNSGKTTLRLDLPDISPLGKLVAMNIGVYFQKPLTSGTQILVTVYNNVTMLSNSSIISNVSTGYTSDGFEDVKTFAVDDAIQSWEDIKNCYVEVATRAAGQEIKVHHVALNPDYVAQARIERPGSSQKVRRDVGYNVAGRRNVGGHLYETTSETSPDLVTFDSPLYGFPLGRKDTAAGLYTGTADLLIEHPVDMVRYLLLRWAGVSAGTITETSGDFGAFSDAKSALSGYRFRTLLSNRTEAAEHIAAIGSEALVWFKRCPTLAGAPWVAVPWEMGSPVDYRTASEPFLFSRTNTHVVEGSFSVGQTRISLVANTLRVNYDWDPRTNSYGDQLYITPSLSRVHVIGDVFGDDPSYDADAADSAALYGEKELVVSLKMVNDPGTASDIMKRLFRLRVTPRLTVRFRTFLNAYDLNRGHVIGFSDDWDARLRYPKAGSDGSWDGKLFRVVAVKRLKESPIQYAVEAVEI